MCIIYSPSYNRPRSDICKMVTMCFCRMINHAPNGHQPSQPFFIHVLSTCCLVPTQLKFLTLQNTRHWLFLRTSRSVRCDESFGYASPLEERLRSSYRSRHLLDNSNFLQFLLLLLLDGECLSFRLHRIGIFARWLSQQRNLKAIPQKVKFFFQLHYSPLLQFSCNVLLHFSTLAGTFLN